MAQSVKTQALAAYVQSCNLKFAGAPLTLQRVAQMLALPPEAINGATLSDAGTLTRIAQMLRTSLDGLVQAVAAMPEPTPAPAPAPEPAPAPAPAPEPAPAPAPEPPPSAQVEAPLPTRESDPEIIVSADVSFDDVEATPPPTTDGDKPVKKSDKKKKR